MENKTFTSLTHDKLSVEEATNFVLSERCGATAVFIGTTRDNFKGKQVVSLEYESYEEMATKEMKSICNKIREQIPNLMHIYICHRLGTVPIKESSIVVATSSPHRADAMKATELLVDMVKASVPVWKKEVYTDGTSEWMSNKECEWCNKTN